jgi:hypothetical protein
MFVAFAGYFAHAFGDMARETPSDQIAASRTDKLLDNRDSRYAEHLSMKATRRHATVPKTPRFGAFP